MSDPQRTVAPSCPPSARDVKALRRARGSKKFLIDSRKAPVDLSPFIEYNPHPDYESNENHVIVGGGVGARHAGERGKVIASIAVKHTGGYGLLVEFPGGEVDVFSPLSLFPAGGGW